MKCSFNVFVLCTCGMCSNTWCIRKWHPTMLQRSSVFYYSLSGNIWQRCRNTTTNVAQLTLFHRTLSAYSNYFSRTEAEPTSEGPNIFHQLVPLITNKLNCEISTWWKHTYSEQHWMITEEISKRKTRPWQICCVGCSSHLILLGFFFFSIFFT